MSKSKNLHILAESAVCVGVAVVLSMITLFTMPLGGSVTPFAILPIITVSLRHGTKWGIATALVYSLTQLMLGMANVLAVPVKNLQSIVLCAALDYVLAYTIIGFTGLITRRYQNKRVGLCVGVCVTGFGRLFCSFVSGVIIWAQYAPEGWNVALYSLAYNALWCVPDTVIVLAMCLALSRVRVLSLLPT